MGNYREQSCSITQFCQYLTFAFPKRKLNPYKSATGCLSVMKDLPNHYSDMVLLHSEASHNPWEVLQIFGEGSITLLREIEPNKIIPSQYKIKLKEKGRLPLPLSSLGVSRCVATSY